MMFGPLMQLFGEFQIPYAGGCKLGTRSIRAHAAAFEELGVNVVAKTGHYNIDSKKKIAKDVVMYETSDTATENILMAAARFDTPITIHLASANYMVQDLCYF